MVVLTGKNIRGLKYSTSCTSDIVMRVLEYQNFYIIYILNTVIYFLVNSLRIQLPAVCVLSVLHYKICSLHSTSYYIYVYKNALLREQKVNLNMYSLKVKRCIVSYKNKVGCMSLTHFFILLKIMFY